MSAASPPAPPARQWMFYTDGRYGPAAEQTLRDFGRQLGFHSDQKGMASVAMEQMWAEIDRLRQQVGEQAPMPDQRHETTGAMAADDETGTVTLAHLRSWLARHLSKDATLPCASPDMTAREQVIYRLLAADRAVLISLQQHLAALPQ